MTQKTQKRFHGERIGKQLADYLNGGLEVERVKLNASTVADLIFHDDAGVERIADIVERLQGITNLAALARKETGKVTERWGDILEDCREKLNRELRYYAGGFIGLSTVDEDGHALFRLYPDRPHFDHKEWDALDWVRRLAGQGLLDRVRRCANEKCRRWFYARFSSQTCCTANGNRCRRQKYRSTPEWKEIHSEQSRRRYHLKKHHNVK